MKTKKVFAFLLSFILIISSMSLTSFAGIYDHYDDVHGTLYRTSTKTVYLNDTVEVILKVDFRANDLSEVVAFDLIGTYSNLTLTGIEYIGDKSSADIPDSDEIDFTDIAEPLKTTKSMIVDKSKDGKIRYTAVLLLDSAHIAEDEDGFGRLVKFTFKASKTGTAKINLKDCYLRKGYTYEDDHRNLIVSQFTFSVKKKDSPGGGGTGGGGISLPPAIEITPTDPGTSTKRKYADIDNTDWHYEQIDKLYDQGYIKGTGVEEDGAIDISPDANITRQEAAKLSVDALRLEVINGIAGFSDDDSAAEWATPYIYTAAAHSKKLIKGYPEDNTFRPFSNITRAEFATIIMNTFDFVMLEEYDLSMFRDSEDITWAAPYIATLVKHNIVQGYEDKCFYPNKFITRAEAFIMMYRALDAFGMIK